MFDKEKAFWVKEPDLVEVVRCKDCDWFTTDEEVSGGLCGVHSVWFDNDDFCSYGERKDNA